MQLPSTCIDRDVEVLDDKIRSYRQLATMGKEWGQPRTLS